MILFLGGIANFAAFGASLWPSAARGQDRNGQHFVVSHGRFTEVSPKRGPTVITTCASGSRIRRNPRRRPRWFVAANLWHRNAVPIHPRRRRRYNHDRGKTGHHPRSGWPRRSSTDPARSHRSRTRLQLPGCASSGRRPLQRAHAAPNPLSSSRPPVAAASSRRAVLGGWKPPLRRND